MSLTIGAIASTLRTPSRIRKSWFSRKKSGWPASDGIFSMRELPSSPWHAAQSAMRAASGSLWASAKPPAQTSAAASPRTSGRRRLETTRLTSRLPAGALRLVGDAIDRAVLLVGDEQRAVLQRIDVGRTAMERIALLVEQPGHERLDLGLGARGARDHNVVAELLVPV